MDCYAEHRPSATFSVSAMCSYFARLAGRQLLCPAQLRMNVVGEPRPHTTRFDNH